MRRFGRTVWRWFTRQVANSLQDPAVEHVLGRIIDRRTSETVEGSSNLPIHHPRITNRVPREYGDLAYAASPADLPTRDPVFITARFRSGSTMLWNMLRKTPGLTAYYEPLHPTLQSDSIKRTPAADPTHHGVDAYWDEYARVDHLHQWYTRPWHSCDLYMDHTSWDPALRRYIDELIRSARGLPVLQFNRVDFRLAWLRHVYPTSRIIHLFRHPRDQWLSTLKDPARFSPRDPASLFVAQDYFFLFDWVLDLADRFPILDWTLVSHPYQMYYLLWKLSYLWGKAYADLSISYEQILTAPLNSSLTILETMGVDSRYATAVSEHVRTTTRGKWRTYADAAWFENHEAAAEELISSLLGSIDLPAEIPASLLATA